MFEYEIDYSETIEQKKLVVPKSRFSRINSFIFLAFTIALGGIFTFLIVKSQMQIKPLDMSDYLIAICTTILFFIISIIWTKTILDRDKLKEIPYSLDLEKARYDVLKTVSNLDWDLFIESNNYLRIKTKFSFTNDAQTITIIYFPDHKIYFNSLNFPNDYIKRARFSTNYQIFTEELNKVKLLTRTV